MARAGTSGTTSSLISGCLGGPRHVERRHSRDLVEEFRFYTARVNDVTNVGYGQRCLSNISGHDAQPIVQIA